MKQFVLDHLIQECRQADRVIACTQQKDSDLSIKLKKEAENIKDLQQYSYSRYASAFEVIPRILA